MTKAIDDLVTKIDPAVFAESFGAGLDQLPALVQAKTVTIASLMDIAPAGTVDPTPNLYNSTMYLMALLLAIALVSNASCARSTPGTTCRKRNWRVEVGPG